MSLSPNCHMLMGKPSFSEKPIAKAIDSGFKSEVGILPLKVPESNSKNRGSCFRT